ncbi:MAG: hypothetical protein OEQ24_10160 [Gammaproteobacteria bacterium]|nr:hypothetical protein [Gammaproteobacteria bacterium]
MPKLTEGQLYELQAAVAETIKKDMQSDDIKVRLPARSCAIKLLKDNRIKVDLMLSEGMMDLSSKSRTASQNY